MTPYSISVVTVSRNRTHHLIECCKRLAVLPHHIEHIVLDLGSSPPVNPCALPDDQRLQLKRVEYSGPWWASHSFNLAMAQATGTILVHCDADCLLTAQFFDQLLHDADVVDFSAARMSLLDWKLVRDSSYPTIGLYWVKCTAYWAVGGLNPYLQGWGYEEIDLMGRLFRAGYICRRQLSCGVTSLHHGDVLRVDTVGEGLVPVLQRRTSTAIKRACARKNTVVSTQMLNHGFSNWPSRLAYQQAYQQKAGLPPVLPISLFCRKHLKALQCELFQVWILAACESSLPGRFLAKALTPWIPRRILEQFLIKLGIFANQQLLDGSLPQSSPETRAIC